MVSKTCIAAFALLGLAAVLLAQAPGSNPDHPNLVHYDGSPWSLKGEGIVCCPCAVPCPCRSNSQPTYGHCEATLYLRIKQGHYGDVDLSGIQVVGSGGMCAVSYHRLSAEYFDQSASPAQRMAYMKLIASFSPRGIASFPYVRAVRIDSEVTGDHLFKVIIPGTLEMIVDRDWGQASPPMPMVAAPDDFANVLQYAENIRYRVHDDAAGINFDYSRRQANYRVVDLANQDYVSKAMLIQFATGKGGFAPEQLTLIKAQHLTIPPLTAIREEALRLRETRSY